jgi:hypothetical protein
MLMSVQDFSKHGGFHETEVARRLHGVHAVPIKWQSRTDALDTMWYVGPAW